MQEIRRRRVTVLGLRAAAPRYVRVLALALLCAGVLFIGVSLYRYGGTKDFRLRPGVAQLSTEVVGVVHGLEHRESKDGRLTLLLKASRDVTFADGHHELEDVQIEVYPEGGGPANKINAQRAITFEENTRFTFSGNVQIETRDSLVAKTEAVDYDLRSELAISNHPISFVRENVSGRADGATLDAKGKRLELRGAVEVTVQPDAQGSGPTKAGLRGLPLVVKSAQANYDHGSSLLLFTGGAVAEQGSDVISGDQLAAKLNAQKRVEKIDARENSYLRSTSPGRAAEIFAINFDFFFDGDQKLTRAKATGNVRAGSLDADSEVKLNAPGVLDVSFSVQGERSLVKEMRAAGGRSVVTMAAPKSKAGDPKAANKRIDADDIILTWRDTGRDLERAEAHGNVELLVEPASPNPAADRKTLLAPHFHCDFYEAGNLARTFRATGGAKAVVEPLQPSETRGTRTLTSQTMTAQFVRETQDVERLEAQGSARFNELQRTLTSANMTALFSRDRQALERVDAQGDAKFNELDRNGQAANISYTSPEGVVRLRGGEPVVWDSRARLKANEIDSDTRNKVSHGRGKVITTYYSQEQTNGAAPFKNLKSPVFVASNSAEFHHDSGVGIYVGAARTWQDDNFVKADRITLRREQRRMDAEGNVQSALYQARRREGGAPTVVPVFATSNRMFFVDGERLLHYEGDVDIRQGTERINSSVADVYLQKESYEVERTVAQRNVVVTQPGKRGTGEWAQYTAADETVVLTGNPARVEDAERGNSESRRMVVYLREDRVVSDGGESRQTTNRVRTTHKVRKP